VPSTANAFIGAESLYLLGFEKKKARPIRPGFCGGSAIHSFRSGRSPAPIRKGDVHACKIAQAKAVFC